MYTVILKNLKSVEKASKENSWTDGLNGCFVAGNVFGGYKRYSDAAEGVEISLYWEEIEGVEDAFPIPKRFQADPRKVTDWRSCAAAAQRWLKDMAGEAVR